MCLANPNITATILRLVKPKSGGEVASVGMAATLSQLEESPGSHASEPQALHQVSSDTKPLMPLSSGSAEFLSIQLSKLNFSDPNRNAYMGLTELQTAIKPVKIPQMSSSEGSQ